MGDVVGRLFREFAITLGVTILISAVVSLTLTPMMCARLLKHVPKEQLPTRGVAAWVQRQFDRLVKGYARTLEIVLEHQNATLAVAVGTLVLTVVLYILVPKGFFPVQDTGIILGVSEAPQSSSFAAVSERQQALAAEILKDPAVESLSSFIGIDGQNVSLNTGRVQIVLKPLEDRDESAQEVIRRLSPKLAALGGSTLFMQPAQDLTVDARSSRTQYQYTLEDANPQTLALWAPRFVQALRAQPELVDVSSDQMDRGLCIQVDIDRATAARLGISPLDIDNALYDAFGQRFVSTIFTELNQYRVVLAAPLSMQEGPSSLDAIYLKSSDGKSVPLTSLVTVRETLGPLVISRQGQFPSVTASFNLAPGASLGEAVEAVRAASGKIGLPDSTAGSFQGTAQAFMASLGNQPLLILAALITVYIVLGVMYESYIHPVTILSTLPSAGVGAVLALMACRMELTVIAVIGIILLIGIVKKNGIMMVDFALEAEREHGLPPREAIYQASLLRFRPIMMTTMAALLGALPMALGTGVGFELRRPLGVSIIGGLVISQALTLYTTPVIYLAFDRLARRLLGRGAAGHIEPPEPPEPEDKPEAQAPDHENPDAP
jgi:multidrug efflux pump